MTNEELLAKLQEISDKFEDLMKRQELFEVALTSLEEGEDIYDG